MEQQPLEDEDWKPTKKHAQSLEQHSSAFTQFYPETFSNSIGKVTKHKLQTRYVLALLWIHTRVVHENLEHSCYLLRKTSAFILNPCITHVK